MGRLFKLIFFLLVLGFAAFLGFAYLGDFAPDRVEVVVPVELDAD